MQVHYNVPDAPQRLNIFAKSLITVNDIQFQIRTRSMTFGLDLSRSEAKMGTLSLDTVAF